MRNEESIKINPQDTLYFLSDAHLEEPRVINNPWRKENLFKFGDGIAGTEKHLFIIGDLFDFWFEWKQVIPKRHFQVLAKLKEWRERGLKLYYLPGNHDFYLGDFLREEIGFYTGGEILNLEVGDKKFHLFHGDGVRKSDRGYRFLKKVVRNGINQRLFRLLHPDWGIKLAEWSSACSRREQEKKIVSDSDYQEYAQMKLAEGFDFVIMGHTHRPALMDLEGGKYLNLGNWTRDFTYGLYQDGDLKLVSFQDERK